MKKIKLLTVLCAIALATALTGCGGKNNGGSSSGKNDKGASKSTDLETIIAEINNYVYKNEPFNIEDSSDIGRIVIKNDTMYVSKAKYDYPEASEGEDGEVGILEEVSTEGDETDAKKAEINFDAGEPDGSDADIEAPSVVGYELEDDNGVIIAEAEMAWESRKIVFLTAEQLEVNKEVFEEHGWTVIDSSNGIEILGGN